MCTYQRSNHLTRATPREKARKQSKSEISSAQLSTYKSYIYIMEHIGPIMDTARLSCIGSHRILYRIIIIIASSASASRYAPCGAKVNDDQLSLRSCLEKNRFHFFEGFGLEHLSTSHAQEGRQLLGDTEQRRCCSCCSCCFGLLLGWASSSSSSSHGCSGSLGCSSGWHDGQEHRHQAAESYRKHGHRRYGYIQYWIGRTVSYCMIIYCDARCRLLIAASRSISI
jgi:hypothetical protein